MDWTTFATGVATGAVTYAIASLVAPWIHYTIEKRRDGRQRHRELIGAWRAMLAKYHRPRYVSFEGLVDDPDYLSLRQYLDSELRRRLEAESGTPENPVKIPMEAEGIAVNPDLVALNEEVDRLEREWKLA